MLIFISRNPEKNIFWYAYEEMFIAFELSSLIFLKYLFYDLLEEIRNP